MAKRQKEIWENPLVPHALMRRMYEGMRELRALEPTAAGRRNGDRGMRGEEACRASSLLSLGAGDLLSDVSGSVAVRRRRGSGRGAAFEGLAPGAVLLSGPTDTMERLSLAIGAASALRAQGAGRLVLAYVEADALTAARCMPLLRLAGQTEAPILFVLLPTDSGKKQGVLSDRAQGWGVPGMPVDAADAVALYRVMQEATLRARGGGGPALVECVTWRPTESETPPMDGVRAMRKLLERRGLLSTKAGTRGQRRTRGA